jgi:hypothetical protein
MAKVQYTSDKGDAIKARQQFNEAYQQLTTGWAALDAAGKQAALRQGLIVVMRMVKWLMAQVNDK